jgi:hypothetical protein
MITPPHNPNWYKRRHLAHEASRWVSVREVGGDNRGEFVTMFQRAVDGRANGEAWCAGFVWFCINAVDATWVASFEKQDPTMPSWLHKSESCMEMWTRSPVACRVDFGVLGPGDLMVWQHWNSNGPTGAGHVGIVEQITGGNAVTIEGNTGDGEGVVREGDGVYRRIRKLTIGGAGSMRLLGFLRPWP